jgi:endo-1,4-beta-D-glucanase Y
MKNLFLLVSIFVCIKSYSQTKPFPANIVFNNGLMANSKSSQDAKANYDTWKSNFVEVCNNNRYRVKFNSWQTVSEGIAYGMLLSVYSSDKTLFDGFWLYYKDNVNSNGVMNWRINGCSGVDGHNGATDAELDAAFALIVADYQWGSIGTINYKNDAKTLIAAIKTYEIEANTFVLKPGDAFGGSQITNPSYFSPAYYRAFGAFTNDTAFWNAVAAKAYTIINNNLTVNNAVGGLVSDWCDGSGNYSSSAIGQYVNDGKTYNYDAARTPWRIVVDYLWYGTPDAKTYSKKASDFVRINLGGSVNIKDGYSQSGIQTGQWHNAPFVGAFACAAMAGENQAHLDASYADLNNINEPDNYFNHTLKTLYSFLLTGNFYLPASATLSNNDFDIEKSTISLYPNPSADKFIVLAPENSLVSIFSPQGNLISEQKTSSKNTEINLANHSSGLYLIKITNGIKSVTKKVIIK